MSSQLWKAYYEDDVDAFRQLLEATAGGGGKSTRNNGGGGNGGIGGGFGVGSPGAMATSPTLYAKGRKVSGYGTSGGGGAGLGVGGLTKAEVNWRDASGLTILHHAVSSTAESAAAFAAALVEHPLVDLYLQDYENGWTALHRAFYFGNVSIARLILEREAGDALGKTTGVVHQTIGLVKMKDREGHGPLDLYAATIKDRTLRPETVGRGRSDSNASDDFEMPTEHDEEKRKLPSVDFAQIDGDEVFTFGSNRNVSLGFGDEDDRQFPERIVLRRPQHLLRRFYREHLKQHERKSSAHDPAYESRLGLEKVTPVDEIPWVIQTKPLIIQDVHMAKLHSAVLTTDPESNLYMCGHGQGGRLGVGDETTRFNFVCVEGGALAGKKIAAVALGQNHTLALSEEGEIFSWGNNGFGQLGYGLPKSTTRDEDPISTTPRQIFQTLKREVITGIAASRIHSVAFTGSSLFTFGKNEGQLGIVDSDARSLEMQVTPRKVAASLFASPIDSVSATDKATVCLLENHDVHVFANYGYAKIAFPLEGFTNYFLKQSFLVTSYDTAPNRVIKVTSGGDTVCALSSRGEIFTLSINQRAENQTASTTNPAKIRSAISAPQCIWSLKKGNMAARDVGVDADGSIILTTEEGSVWRRTKRAKIKDATASGIGEYKPKDYKFSRIPGLTRVLAVRASAHGAYAAVRRDCDVTKTQIVVEDASLWKDVLPMLALKSLAAKVKDGEDEETRPRFWQGTKRPDELQLLKRAILESQDLEADLADICKRCLEDSSAKCDAVLATTASELRIPVHRVMLTGRSRVLRRGFRDLCDTSTFTIPDLAVSEMDKEGRAVVKFQGLDILSVVDLALYLYTDTIVDFWHVRNAQHLAYRYRQVRTDLMKIASKLELVKLEPAVRQMIEPRACLDMDFEVAFQDPAYFYDGDAVVQLEDDEMRVHSVVVCARCPFFEGLFMGRAGGRWLAGREEQDAVPVDLTHIASKTFALVLRHIYTDAGPELFDDIASGDVDDFLDTVMDVLSAANELMLDRLSQICQSVIGRYVNARNVCWLLNAISPSSVHEFKHAGLEYLCLNLEAMLQGHHLNELDEDLLLELDEVVRQNQLACMPFAKSGRAELELHERHPELAGVLNRNKRAKIDSVRLRSKFHDMETFTPGSLGDDAAVPSPMQQKSRRRSSNAVKADAERPSLKAKASTKDMMFSMDEEVETSPSPSPAIRGLSTPNLDAVASNSLPEGSWGDTKGKGVASPPMSRLPPPSTPGQGTPRTPKSPLPRGQSPVAGASAWTATPLAGARKTDFKEVMAQASSNRTSSLSQGLKAAQQQGPSPSSANAVPARMSQKERKKMLQQQQSQFTSSVPQASNENSPAKGSPWQTVSATKVPSLKDVIDGQKGVSSPPQQPAKQATGRAASTPQLTMRQTVANPKPSPTPSKPIIGPSSSHNAHHTPPRQHVKPAAPQSPQPTNSKPIPQSIRHTPRPVEASLQLSMQDILAQQQREKEVVKEAVARRDLGEIQAEQAFQEWWDMESARVQGEAEGTGTSSGGNRGEGKGGKGGKGGRGRGGEKSRGRSRGRGRGGGGGVGQPGQ